MFTSFALTALLASSLLVVYASYFVLRPLKLNHSHYSADPNPTTPGPGAVYNSAAQCPIAWDVDPTGVWTTMNIQLMTGDNLNMIPLTSAFPHLFA
jgi:hypothetical protein